MSNYRAEALNPKTCRVENADWIDNYFGHHVYGVKFDDGEVYHAWDVGLLAAGKRMEALCAALRGMVDMYVQLVESGDAGFWDAEKVEEVIAARAALAHPSQQRGTEK